MKVQTDIETLAVQPQYDETALLEFLKKFAPKVELELRKGSKHFDADYQWNLANDEEIITKKIGNLMKHEKINEVRSISVKLLCKNEIITLNMI